MAKKALKKVEFYQTNNPENKRELAQHGIYSFTDSFDDLEDVIRQDKVNSPRYFRKIVFKIKDSKNCRNFLTRLGVTPKHLFPNSIEGAVEYCRSFIPFKSIFRGGILSFNFIPFDRVKVEECVKNTLINNIKYSIANDEESKFASKVIASEILDIYKKFEGDEDVLKKITNHFDSRYSL